MIHEVAGDILLTKARAIAHGVAPNDHFDNGLALALREKWPALAREFRHYARQTHPKPGEIWSWAAPERIRVFNLMTQEGAHGHGARPGRANVVHVNHCLRRLRHELEKGEVASLAMPRIATGVGGLAWADVQRLIQQHLGGLDLPMFVYTTYRRGEQAVEPGM